LINEGAVLAEFGSVVALADAYPVTAGHTLLMPRKHEPDFFALTREERIALLDAVSAMRERLTAEVDVDGFNVGLNSGKAAGQTVSHTHIHLIPRRRGDVPDPRGGVRWIFPKTADYWTHQ
jgi:diadenosine tetraphosphate (Ap4A) HIT family hydrolase